MTETEELSAGAAQAQGEPVAASRTRGGLLRRVPLPLGLLLVVVAFFGTAWSLLTPAWQVPDEIAHFAYVQTIAENGRLPGSSGGPYSTELQRATQVTNSQPTIFFRIAHPEWSPAVERTWDRQEGHYSRTDGGGGMPASSYPPLYYAYEALPYLLAKDGDIFTRLGVMRIASMLWLLVTTLAVWLLAGELFGRRRLPQLLAAATAGLWPMVLHVNAGVNPDSMLYAFWTLALWQGVVMIKHGLTTRRAVTFGLLIGAATITKVSALALLPPALVLLAWLAWRARARPGLLAAVLGAAALALPMVAWTGYTKLDHRSAYSQAAEVANGGPGGNPQVREFASYLWQFYFPKLGFMTPINHHVPVISRRPVYNTWIGMSWGAFGWVTNWYPAWAYKIFGAVTALLALLAIAAALRRRWGLRDSQQRAAVLFLAGVTVVTVGGVHWTDYQFYAAGKGLFAQGRYLFPLIGVGATVVAYALCSLPRRARWYAAGFWLAGLLVYELSAFGLLQAAWYA
jgi:4-amino-4-deoxy-L-arabinose transferase-like glycosyltransferase